MPRLRFRVAPSGEPSRSPGQRFAGDHVVDLLRKLFQLARRRHDVDGEPGLRAPDDFAFDPPETYEIGDDSLADRSGGEAADADPDRRDILRLTRELSSVRQHVAPLQRQGNARVSTTLILRARRNCGSLERPE